MQILASFSIVIKRLINLKIALRLIIFILYFILLTFRGVLHFLGVNILYFTSICKDICKSVAIMISDSEATKTLNDKINDILNESHSNSMEMTTREFTGTNLCQ